MNAKRPIKWGLSLTFKVGMFDLVLLVSWVAFLRE